MTYSLQASWNTFGYLWLASFACIVMCETHLQAAEKLDFKNFKDFKFNETSKH